MRNRALVSACTGIALGAVLCGCAGQHSQAALPFGDAASPSPFRHVAEGVSRHGTWMAAGLKDEALIYISDGQTNDVDVYSFARRKLVGKLTGLYGPSGLCADKAGDVFVPDPPSGRILEYAHGGTTPINTLTDEEEPVSCSVDPVTGDLAVMDGGPRVSIYAGAQGDPTDYSDPNMSEMWYTGYDGSGNLFVDGFQGSAPEVDELPSGGSTFAKISLDVSLGFPGDIQWDGQNVDIGDELAQPQVIDHFAMSGSSGQLVAQTLLNAAQIVIYYWFQKGKVVAVDDGYNLIWFYNYPAGGDPTALIAGIPEPIGVTISKGK